MTIYNLAWAGPFLLSSFYRKNAAMVAMRQRVVNKIMGSGSSIRLIIKLMEEKTLARKLQKPIAEAANSTGKKYELAM